jgi:hypothetical protein
VSLAEIFGFARDIAITERLDTGFCFYLRAVLLVENFASVRDTAIKLLDTQILLLSGQGTQE